MILLTNGCSWTWGGGLQLETSQQDLQRLASVWPAHLSKLLNAEKVYNLSMGCGSNQRILRTTLDWILQQTPETLSNTVAVIQWSELSRYEFYVPEKESNVYENFPERWVLAKVGCILNPYAHDTEKELKKVNSRLETYTEIEGFYRNIFECAALDNIFKMFGIKYYYWHYYNFYTNPPEHLLNVMNKFNWLKDSGNWKYQRVSPKDDHPSLEGHKEIAKIIYQQITNQN